MTADDTVSQLLAAKPYEPPRLSPMPLRKRLSQAVRVFVRQLSPVAWLLVIAAVAIGAVLGAIFG